MKDRPHDQQEIDLTSSENGRSALTPDPIDLILGSGLGGYLKVTDVMRSICPSNWKVVSAGIEFANRDFGIEVEDIDELLGAAWGRFAVEQALPQLVFDQDPDAEVQITAEFKAFCYMQTVSIAAATANAVVFQLAQAERSPSGTDGEQEELERLEQMLGRLHEQDPHRQSFEQARERLVHQIAERLDESNRRRCSTLFRLLRMTDGSGVLTPFAFAALVFKGKNSPGLEATISPVQVLSADETAGMIEVEKDSVVSKVSDHRSRAMKSNVAAEGQPIRRAMEMLVYPNEKHRLRVDA